MSEDSKSRASMTELAEACAEVARLHAEVGEAEALRASGAPEVHEGEDDILADEFWQAVRLVRGHVWAMWPEYTDSSKFISDEQLAELRNAKGSPPSAA